jgi:hypothetical protein
MTQKVKHIAVLSWTKFSNLSTKTRHKWLVLPYHTDFLMPNGIKGIYVRIVVNPYTCILLTYTSKIGWFCNAIGAAIK